MGFFFSASDVEWAYARRSDLLARVYSDQIGGGVTSTDGRRRLAVPEHDWLHLRGCGNERPSSASELPARNYFALPSVRMTEKPIATQLEHDRGDPGSGGSIPIK
jgi:hypothetical protein